MTDEDEPAELESFVADENGGPGIGDGKLMASDGACGAGDEELAGDEAGFAVEGGPYTTDGIAGGEGTCGEPYTAAGTFIGCGEDV